MANVTEKHGVTLHAFADDTQLYLHCRHDDMASTALQLERCLSDVGHWCLPIDWSWMLTRPSFSGLDPGTVALPWATVVPSYSSEMIPSFLPTMLKCLKWHCRLIWQWTNTFPTSARPDFIGCGNFDMFGGHWTRSRLQPSCTPSSCPTSITAMYCWLGHRRLQLTSYSVFWMLQHAFSVVRRSLIVDCLSLCMSTFISSMFRSE